MQTDSLYTEHLWVFIQNCVSFTEECQKPFDQNMSIILSCPPSVEGSVTWSRETNGSKVDILTADGDKGKKHIHDLDGRYSLLANKSLVILRAAVYDAGRYFCNSEAAGELTVMNSGNIKL